MEREIKFRAWDKRINKMVFADSDFDELGKELQRRYKDGRWREYEGDEWFPAREIEGLFAYFNSMAENESFELMQYTGLKDKNGVEIYEGDILKTYVNPSRGKSYTRNEPVYWHESFNDEYAYWESGFHIWTPDWKAESVEVIGNIYETPELLTK